MRTTQSIMHILDEHFHSVGKCYPESAAPVTIPNDGGGAWTAGTKTTVIPAGTVGDMFDIHFVVMTNISNADVYQLVLYAGDALAEVEIARIPFADTGAFVSSAELPTQTPLIDAGTRISASLESASGNIAYSVDLYLMYHEY